MSFVTDAEISVLLKDQLRKAASKDLVEAWASVVRRANRAAYNLILRVWLKRGYTKAHIDAWDFGVEFQAELALWWAMQFGAAVDPTAFDASQLKILDRREELEDKNNYLVISGVMTQSDNDYGQVVYGAYDTTEDMFVADTEDVRRGVITRF